MLLKFYVFSTLLHTFHHMIRALLFVITFISFISNFFFIELLQAESSAVVLRSQDLPAYSLAINGFVNECKRNGIVIKAVEDMAGRLDKGLKILKRYDKQENKPDLFLAVGVLAATLAKKAVKDVPIIFCMVVNYQRFNLRASNISGIASEVSEENSLKIFKDALQGLKNVGILYDPLKTRNMMANIKETFVNSGLKLTSVTVKSKSDVNGALKKIINEIDALWLIPDSTVISRKSFSDIFKLTEKAGIPILCSSAIFVKAGALIGVYPDFFYTGVLTGKMANKILKDGDFDFSSNIKHPDKIEIAINLKTASTIKIKIVEDIYKQYDVIEYP